MKFLTPVFCALLLMACTAKAPEGTFTQDANGVVVTPASGPAKRVRVNVVSPRIVRVTAVPDENLELPASLMAAPAAGKTAEFKASKDNGAVVVETAQVRARISLANGAVSVTDAAGKPLLEEEPRVAWA